MKVLQLSNKIDVKSDTNAISLLRYQDIEEVALLTQIYFPRSKEVSLNYLKDSIKKLYFDDGVLGSHSYSLVNRSDDGTINGFLGVISSSFQYNDRTIRVANCHHLMATEQARSKLVPMRMLQEFISGPQNLSFADNSSESTRLLWKRLGGEPAIGECLYYKIPLRPISFTLRHLKMNFNQPLRLLSDFLAKGADSVAHSFRIPLFYRNSVEVNLRPLTPDIFLGALHKISGHYSVFPHYDHSKVEKLFSLLKREKRYGTLHKLVILDENEGVVGWFIYYSVNGGICEVIQAVCVPGKESTLFNSLTWHAYEHGGIELSGRLMPNQLRSPFALKAVCMPARMWTLFHCRDTELMLDIQTGKAFFTRLEGDLWLI